MSVQLYSVFTRQVHQVSELVPDEAADRDLRKSDFPVLTQHSINSSHIHRPDLLRRRGMSSANELAPES